jgi:hypothetical protein
MKLLETLRRVLRPYLASILVGAGTAYILVLDIYSSGKVEHWKTIVGWAVVAVALAIRTAFTEHKRNKSARRKQSAEDS